MKKNYGYIFLVLSLLPFYAQAEGYGSLDLQPLAPAPVNSFSDFTPVSGPAIDPGVQAVTDALISEPIRAEEILRLQMGVDTSKLDIAEFQKIVARGYYDEVYHEVSILERNRQALNDGSFTNLRYYKVAEPEPVVASGYKAGASRASTNTVYALAGVAAAGGAIALAAGGGGGSSGGSTVQDVFGRQPIADLVAPSTFLTPEMTSYESNALQLENAHYAYAKGLTGAGVNIGFYDVFNSDLSTPSSELGSRIIYRNIDTATDCLFYGSDCAHGPVVMNYASEERNGTGGHGMAYGANLMMASFTATDVTDLGDNGANIINLSCGNCATLNELQELQAKGILTTISTGNTNSANPASPADFASLLDYSAIAVTGVYYELDGTLNHDVYNDCGSQREFCMTAISNSGTSFAAPQIAGAAALIKQGWSFLTAKQISQILLYSATDIGAAGVDNIYGHGLLNLKAASEPIGSISAVNGLGNSVNYVPSSIRQNQNTAFGDAFSNASNASGSAVIVDSFGRDFQLATADNLLVARTPTLTPELVASLGKQSDVKTMQFNERMSMNFANSVNKNGRNDMSGAAQYALNSGTRVKLGFATGMDSVADVSLQKFQRRNFISADVFDNGYLNFSDNNQVYYQNLDIDLTAELSTKFTSVYSKNTDNAYNFMTPLNQVTSNYASNMVETRYTPQENLVLNFKNGVTHEFDSVLGTRSSGLFDMSNGANTYFTGMDVSYDLGYDINLFAAYNTGVTKTTPAANSSFSDVSDIVSDSFSVTSTKNNLLGRDSLSFSVGQPTRVKSGTATGLTQKVDRTTGAARIVGYQQELAPTGRTMLFQTAYQKQLGDKIGMNLAFEYASQPDHQSDKKGEATTLLKMVYKLN